MTDNEMTGREHWEAVWAIQPRMSFPSVVDIGTRSVLRLLNTYLHPADIKPYALS